MPLHKCSSGKHTWTDPADAEKCCNGWHREIRIGATDGKATFPGGPRVKHVWVRDCDNDYTAGDDESCEVYND